MTQQSFTPEQRRAIRRQMRVPVFAFVAMMSFLAIIVILAFAAPSRISSGVEFALLVAMVLTMLLFSMEIREEAGLMRFFASIGFAWVAVMFAFLMVDYLTR